METVFVELSLIMAIAALVAAIAKLFRQPLIIAYIIAGILASPHFLGLMESAEVVAGFAQIGVALLLFIVGLQLNPKVLKKLGGTSLIVGLGQIIITGGIGYFLANLLGFDQTTSFFIAAALTFSSTIIIMKLLSDINDLNSLYGRLSVGLLIVQDLVVVLVLLIVSSVGSGLTISELAFGTIFKMFVLFVPLGLFSAYILPKILRFVADSRELLFIFSFGWAFLIATIFHYFEFSIEIGALAAGVALSISPFKDEISSRIRPVRDFFVILFFIWLGSQMVFTNIGSMIVPVVVLSVFVLIFEPLIIISLLGWLGFTRRTGFLTGLAMAQISEFSFILLALGVKNGLIEQNIFSLVAVVGLITITASSYLIMYGKKIYPLFSQPLKIFEREKVKQEKVEVEVKKPEVILFGYNRIGHSLIKALRKISESYLVIDNDPEIIDELEEENLEHIYGDATDPELLDKLNFDRTKMIVSTVPDYGANRELVEMVRKENENIVIILVAHQIEEARELYSLGADYVIMPHFLGGDYGAKIIEKFGFNVDKYYLKRKDHIRQLKDRMKVGHEHPLPEKRV